MKILIYIALFFAAAFLFLPQTGTDQIRNLPILLLILALALIYVLFRLFKYVGLMAKTIKLLKKKGINPTKIRFNPFASRLHGRYNVIFQYGTQTVELALISRKRKYQRYHFESADRVEFYRANRVVFNSIKIRGATVSDLVEVNRVGKRRIKWEDSPNSETSTRVILFDKLPDYISDSVKKENLGAGESICNSEAFILDWQSFCRYFN